MNFLNNNPIIFHKKYLIFIKTVLIAYILFHFGFIYLSLERYLPQVSQILILMIVLTCLLAIYNSYALLLYIPLSFIFFLNNLSIYGINHDYISLAVMVYLLLIKSNIDHKNEKIVMPNQLYHGLWFFFGISYFCSALNKILVTDLWRSPEGFSFFVKNSPVFKSLSLFQNHQIQLLIYGISLMFLAVELLFIVSFFIEKLRKYFFVLSFCTHLGIFTFTKMSEISLSVLLMHLFLFKNDWIRREKIN